jgi:hypothetical protein
LESEPQNNILQAYKSYARWKKTDPPKFKRRIEQLYVSRSQLDELIAGSEWKMRAFLQLLKESGARLQR